MLASLQGILDIMTEVRETQSNEKSSDSDNAPEQERSNTSIADLEKGLRGLEDADEDLAELLANNWQRVLGLLALCLSGVWVFNQYKVATLKRQYSASESFANVQNAFEQLGTSDAEEVLEKNKSLMSENIKHLKSSADDSVLTLIADLYTAQQLIRTQKYSEADTALKPIIEQGAKQLDRTSHIAVVGELADLLLARSLILQSQPDAARKSLFNLLSQGGATSVEAAVVLASISTTADERKSLADAAKNASASHPVIAEDLKTELNKFGISLQ